MAKMKVLLFSLICMMYSMLKGSEAVFVSHAALDEQKLVEQFRDLFKALKEDKAEQQTLLYKELKALYEKKPIDVDKVKLTAFHTIGAALSQSISDAGTFSYNQLNAAANCPSLLNSRINKVFEIALLVQNERSNKDNFFLHLAISSTLFCHYDVLKHWLDKHPVNVDTNCYFKTILSPSFEQWITEELAGLDVTRREPYRWLKVAEIVQKYRTDQTAVFKFLFDRWKKDNSVFIHLKSWFEMFPYDVDTINYEAAEEIAKNLKTLWETSKDQGTFVLTNLLVKEEDLNLKRSLAQDIAHLLQTSSEQGVTIARLVQRDRTNKTIVMKLLFSKWMNDDSVFEQLKLWFENFPCDVDALEFFPGTTIGQEINNLLRTNKNKGRKIALLVQHQRSDKRFEVF